MEDSKIQYFEKVESEDQKEFVQSQNNCVLCGSVLELRHFIEADLSIKEEAHCPECELRARAKIFTLH